MRRMLAATAAVALLVGVPGTALAADPDVSMAKALKSRAQSSALGDDVTVYVANATTGTGIFALDADEKQLPASTMKVVTAATAMATLGQDHRFVTKVVQGTRPGELVVVGGGDPMLTASQLQRLAARTAKQWKKRALGGPITLTVDDYLFPAHSSADGWAPGDSPSYAAAVRPLAMLGEYSSDPVSTAASVFVSALRAKGLEVDYAGRAVAPPDAQILASVDDNTVADAVELMLRVSENNIAEVLFRDVALARGYPATWSSAAAAAYEALGELGIDTSSLRLKDGSGLSEKDRLTARALTEILDLTVDPDHPELAAIRGWLPVAGRTGTLTYRFNGPASCARDEVFAKTGSITGVSTLAGLTRGADGEWKSFAIMVNHAPWASSSTSLAIDTLAATVNGCA